MAGKSTESTVTEKLTEVLYVGKNHSYTVAGIRFDKGSTKARVNAKTAELLVKTGKFTEVR